MQGDHQEGANKRLIADGKTPLTLQCTDEGEQHLCAARQDLINNLQGKNSELHI